MGNSNDGVLVLCVKWDGGFDSSCCLEHDLVDGEIGILEPLDHRGLGSIANWDIEGIFSHFDVGCSVVQDALFE
jgi:hypothetical protein